jgi:hypothetical protein
MIAAWTPKEIFMKDGLTIAELSGPTGNAAKSIRFFRTEDCAFRSSQQGREARGGPVTRMRKVKFPVGLGQRLKC